jgi:hypothetical protein
VIRPVPVAERPPAASVLAALVLAAPVPPGHPQVRGL